MSLVFKNSEKAKNSIMVSQKKEIIDLYDKWADEIGKKAEVYSHKSNASAPLSERYYKELSSQIRQTSQEVANEVYDKIKTNMYLVSDSVVADNVEWLKSFGFDEDGLNAAFSFVPNDVVQNLITGQIYESGWSLSSRIWSDNEQTLKEIYEIVAQGRAENIPIYDIAKELEAYVRPGAKLPWNLEMKDGKRIYKKQVDYNAQRLARTLVQHSYQQSFIATTKNNPFVIDYIWHSNGSRVCEICEERDGKHFAKDELPMDHPNGMCVMEPNIAENMADQLADWFNSPDGTYPEIDEFAGNFGYEAKPESKNDVNGAVDGKNLVGSWDRRPDEFKFEIEDIINAQGFDGLPKVVSASEFDEYVKQSNFIAQRSYSAPTQEVLDEYRNQLYYGKWYVDCSNGGCALGRGMYVVSNDSTSLSQGALYEAQSYRRGATFANTENITLMPGSKIIEYRDLERLTVSTDEIIKMNADSLSMKFPQFSPLLEKYKTYDDTFDAYMEASNTLSKDEYKEFKNLRYDIRDEMMHLDMGSRAALMGYDAIVNHGSGIDTDYTVILNRTKVVIRGE